mmetsp:Transcript_26977/g.68611  ORF Transcript_26977/g.68611 Transcript_26977/m.68611 type:complete len:86 (-) Transcript_26977:219-476(-)
MVDVKKGEVGTNQIADAPMSDDSLPTRSRGQRKRDQTRQATDECPWQTFGHVNACAATDVQLDECEGAPLCQDHEGRLADALDAM